MEIEIGLRGITKALSLEVAMSEQELRETIHNALQNPDQMLVLKAAKDREFLINPRLLAYCEIDSAPITQVGFGIG